MGQRHQIYVYRKSKWRDDAAVTRCIGAFHDQWCYGITATSNVIRLAEAVQKAKGSSITRKGEWNEHGLTDAREIDVLVKSIYGIEPDSGYVSMVHNEAEFLIDEEGRALPQNGDNNDGAALIIIDDVKGEVRACMFTPGHVEGSHGGNAKPWKAWTPAEYLAFYYNAEELLKLDPEYPTRSEAIKRSVKPILQAEFNKLLGHAFKKPYSRKGAA